MTPAQKIDALSQLRRSYFLIEEPKNRPNPSFTTSEQMAVWNLFVTSDATTYSTAVLPDYLNEMDEEAFKGFMGPLETAFKPATVRARAMSSASANSDTGLGAVAPVRNSAASISGVSLDGDEAGAGNGASETTHLVAPAPFDLDEKRRLIQREQLRSFVLYLAATAFGGYCAVVYFGSVAEDCAKELNALTNATFGTELPRQGELIEIGTAAGGIVTNFPFNGAAVVGVLTFIAQLGQDYWNGKKSFLNVLGTFLLIGGTGFIGSLPYLELMAGKPNGEKYPADVINLLIAVAGAIGLWNFSAQTVIPSAQSLLKNQAPIIGNTSMELAKSLNMLQKRLKYADRTKLMEWGKKISDANPGSIAQILALDPANKPLTIAQIKGMDISALFQFAASIPLKREKEVPTDGRLNAKRLLLSLLSIPTVLGLGLKALGLTHTGNAAADIFIGIIAFIMLVFEMVYFGYGFANRHSVGVVPAQMHAAPGLKYTAHALTAVLCAFAVLSWPATTTAMMEQKVLDLSDGATFSLTMLVLLSTIVANVLALTPFMYDTVSLVGVVARHKEMSNVAAAEKVVDAVIGVLGQLAEKAPELTEGERQQIAHALEQFVAPIAAAAPVSATSATPPDPSKLTGPAPGAGGIN